MLSVAILSFGIGVALTIFVQEMIDANNRYKDRKQAEFEAAVAAAAAHRRAQAERDWSTIQTGIGDTARHAEMQNVRAFRTDDPFRDL